MMKLLVFKEHLKKLYNKYNTYINLLIKMMSVIIALLVINLNIGYMPKLKNPLVVIILGFMAAFLPNGINVLLVSAVIVGHLYQLSMELSVVVLAIMVFMYLIYYRFTPKDSYILILLPVLFCLKLPYVVPLVVGLVATPVSVISVTFGIILYYIMLYAKQNVGTIANVQEDTGVKKMASLLESLIRNKEMWLIIVTFAVVVILVYVIRRLSVDYAWTIAIVMGSIVNILMILLGGLVLGKDVHISIWGMMLASIISMGIVYVLHFLILSVDYTRTEYVQFEDDDYYYYVKAVPKINVTTQDVTVKRINAKKQRRGRR